MTVRGSAPEASASSHAARIDWPLTNLLRPRLREPIEEIGKIVINEPADRDIDAVAVQRAQALGGLDDVGVIGQRLGGRDLTAVAGGGCTTSVGVGAPGLPVRW